MGMQRSMRMQWSLGMQRSLETQRSMGKLWSGKALLVKGQAASRHNWESSVFQAIIGTVPATAGRPT